MLANDIHKVLEKAVQSPDEVIRSVAIRYKKVKQELSELEGFFQYYATGLSGEGTPPPATGPFVAQATVTTSATTASVSMEPATASPRAKRGRKKRSQDPFLDQVSELLTAHGGPMDILTLYEQFAGKWPDDAPESCNVFRSQLYRRRDKGQLSYDRKTGYALPVVTPNGVDADVDAHLAA